MIYCRGCYRIIMKITACWRRRSVGLGTKSQCHTAEKSVEQVVSCRIPFSSQPVPDQDHVLVTPHCDKNQQL